MATSTARTATTAREKFTIRSLSKGKAGLANVRISIFFSVSDNVHFSVEMRIIRIDRQTFSPGVGKKTDSMPEFTVQLHNLLGGIQIIKPEAGHIYNARVLQFATLRFGIPCASSVLDGTQSTTQSPSMLPPILWPIASKIEKGIDAADCPVP
jgi:hypothetical protein